MMVDAGSEDKLFRLRERLEKKDELIQQLQAQSTTDKTQWKDRELKLVKKLHHEKSQHAKEIQALNTKLSQLEQNYCDVKLKILGVEENAMFYRQKYEDAVAVMALGSGKALMNDDGKASNQPRESKNKSSPRKSGHPKKIQRLVKTYQGKDRQKVYVLEVGTKELQVVEIIECNLPPSYTRWLSENESNTLTELPKLSTMAKATIAKNNVEVEVNQAINRVVNCSPQVESVVKVPSDVLTKDGAMVDDDEY